MSDDSEQFFKEMLLMYNAHRLYSIRRFNTLGLTSGQPKVLHILFEEEGYLQKDLASKCRVEPATMTSLLSKMEKQNLIQKETVYVSGGKRAYSIYLTDFGRKIAKQVVNITTEADRIATNGMTEDERQTFFGMMRQARCNLSQLNDDWEGEWNA